MTAYDAKWVMVKCDALEVATRLARLYLEDLEDCFSDRKAYEDEIADSMEAIKTLEQACTGDQPKSDPPAINVSIDRAELERLQALERKIGAFLSRVSFQSACCLDIDDIMIMCTWGHPYTVSEECGVGETKQRFEFQTAGHAMCKAFEMFTVPGEAAE